VDELACFSEASRQRAFERFEFLRAHLEDGRPLAAIAREAGLSYRTLQYWLERYRTSGLAALAHKQRTDRGRRRKLSATLQEVIEGLAPPQGPLYGREAIQKFWTDFFKQFHVSNHVSKDDPYSPHIIGTAGNEVWRNAEWSETLQGQNGGPIQLKGYWSAIEVHEGDAWRHRMLTVNVTPAPAPAQTK
jgi:transposase